MLGYFYAIFFLIFLQNNALENLNHDDDMDHEHYDPTLPKGEEVDISDLKITLNCTLTIWPLTINREIRRTVNIHKLSAIASNSNEDPLLLMGDLLKVLTRCSCCTQEKLVKIKSMIATSLVGNNNISGKIYLRIRSSNKYAINILKTKEVISTDSEEKHESHEEVMGDNDDCTDDAHCLEVYSRTKVEDIFYLDTASLGKSKISVDLVWVNDTKYPDVSDIEHTEEFVNAQPIDKMYRIRLTDGLFMKGKYNFNLSIKDSLSEKLDIYTSFYEEIKNLEENNLGNKSLWINSTKITVLIKPRIVNLAFDIGAVAVVCMGVMSVGCCNYKDECKSDITSMVPILIGVTIQTLIIPIIGLCLSILFRLKNEVAVGLFVTSTLPGGGLAHLLVFLAQGNRYLSKFLSLIVVIVNIFTATTWILIVGYAKFNLIFNWYRLIFWLVFTAGMQTLVTVLNKYIPTCTRFLLTWLTRPLLLLAGIFLITLGVYINHYVFHHVSKMLLLALLLLITLAFLIGYIFGILSGCKKSGAKTFSTEFSVFNGLLAIVILRTCLHGPEGDLASMVSLWASFFTPVPWVYHEMMSFVQRSYDKHIRKIDPDTKGFQSISNLNLSELYTLQSNAGNSLKRYEEEPETINKQKQSSIFSNKKIIQNRNAEDISLVMISDNNEEPLGEGGLGASDKKKRGKVI